MIWKKKYFEIYKLLFNLTTNKLKEYQAGKQASYCNCVFEIVFLLYLKLKKYVVKGKYRQIRKQACNQRPPQILADQKAPPGSGGAPHYYLNPRIFDPCCTPGRVELLISEVRAAIHSTTQSRVLEWIIDFFFRRSL